MKSVLKLLYIALVSVPAFLGALYIAAGMRDDGAPSSRFASAEYAQAATLPLTEGMNQGEGSAL